MQDKDSAKPAFTEEQRRALAEVYDIVRRAAQRAREAQCEAPAEKCGQPS